MVMCWAQTDAVAMQADAAERAREAEELRQQLSSGAQHADALATAQSRTHDLEQQLKQLQAALQQENGRAQEALQARFPYLKQPPVLYMPT